MIDRFDTLRLRLRPISLDDVDALVALDSDPEVMRFLTNGKPSQRDDVAAEVRSRLGQRWMAYHRATGEFAGWFGLVKRGPGHYELGYRLVRRSWGRGLATEGSRALVDRAFRELGAERISAETMAVNTRSQRVMERAGLHYLRTSHLQWDDPIPGTEHGEVEYELLRADWEARPGAAGGSLTASP